MAEATKSKSSDEKDGGKKADKERSSLPGMGPVDLPDLDERTALGVRPLPAMGRSPVGEYPEPEGKK